MHLPSSSTVTGAVSSAASFCQPPSPASAESKSDDAGQIHRNAFQGAPVGMAIASLGGLLLECNPVFCQWAGSTTQDIRQSKTTIFNLIAKEEMPQAYASLHAMLSPEPKILTDTDDDHHERLPVIAPITVRAVPLAQQEQQQHNQAGQTRTLHISMMLGADGRREHLCLTLMGNDTTDSRSPSAIHHVDGHVPPRHAIDPMERQEHRSGTLPVWIAPDTSSTSQTCSGYSAK